MSGRCERMVAEMRAVLVGVGALGVATLRVRVRSLFALLANPLALVFSAAASVGFVWLLIAEGGNPRATIAAPVWLEVACYVFGLTVILVTLTAQRGSPLRLSLADVSWVLQSREGPRVILFFQFVQGSAMAFCGSSAGSALALGIRGENPLWGVVTGAAVGIALLTLRTASLASHLIGLLVPRWGRIVLLGSAGSVAVAWTLAFAEVTLSLTGLHFARAFFERVVQAAQAFFMPERGLPVFIGVAFCVVVCIVTVCLRYSKKFVEPAVQESILARQISQALAGDSSSLISGGRGVKTGIGSWMRWPDSAPLALLVAHWAQFRRRFTSMLVSALLYSGIVLAGWCMRDVIPMGLSVLVVVALVAMTGPAQHIATDLEHQHLRLSQYSLVRLGFVGLCSNAAHDVLTLLPAYFLWVWLRWESFGPFAVCMPALLALCCTNALGGMASHVFAARPIGRSAVSVALILIPVLASLSATSIYGQIESPGRTTFVMCGTLGVAALLYAGVYWGHLMSGSRR